MKGWCKIIELEGYDILVQRLVSKSDGEHIHITVRFPEGQYITKAQCGDGEVAEKMCKEVYSEYNSKDAQKFVKIFNDVLNGKQPDKKDDKDKT